MFFRKLVQSILRISNRIFEVRGVNLSRLHGSARLITSHIQYLSSDTSLLGEPYSVATILIAFTLQWMAY